MVTRLRSSTDGMGVPLVVKKWIAAHGFVGLRAAADKARPIAASQGASAESAAASITPARRQMLGFERARRERDVDFVRRQRPDLRGDEAIAEIALRIEVARPARARSRDGQADRRRWRSASRRRRRRRPRRRAPSPRRRCRARSCGRASPRSRRRARGRSPRSSRGRTGSGDPGDRPCRSRTSHPARDVARCRRRC